MFKLVIFLCDLAVALYIGYIAFLKPEVTMKDLAFIGFIVFTNVMINQGRLERR